MPSRDPQPKNNEKVKRTRPEIGGGGQDQLPRDLRQDFRDRQFQHQVGEGHILSPQTSSLNLASLSQLRVYDHILQLRKHGISMKLGTESTSIMSHLAADGQLPWQQNNAPTSQTAPVEVHNPPYHEMDLLNQALVTMLSLGADLEIPGLEPYQAIKCSSCSEQFVTQAQKDDHCNRGQPTCPNCPKVGFPCASHRDAHIRDTHRPPHPLPNRSSLDAGYGAGWSQ